MTATPSIVIIGAGFAGLGMALELQRAGIDNFTIVEKAGDLGGVWRENTYPGAACDVPSPLYSWSFEPKSDWPRRFSQQRDIHAYMRAVAEKHDLPRKIRFGIEVTDAEFDAVRGVWQVRTADGETLTADVLIPAVGQLSRPAMPNIPGVDTFTGPAFHSAEWDHDVDLTGKRVAVIGTGASAIQIVPSIVNDVSELQLYQRTPPWVVPRPNKPFPEALKRAFAYVPGLRAAVRDGIYWGLEGLGFAMTRRPALLRGVELVGKWNIRRHVKDKELRRRLTPTYTAGCKRILYSPNYYWGVANPKCQLITDRISRITPGGIVTADGEEHAADVIVYATGFHVTDSYTYVDIKGAGGEDLVDRWNREGVVAHRGVAVADMPNLFFLLGPNTGLGHTSVVFMIEQQVRYVAQAIAAVDKYGAQALAPTRSAQDRDN